jgi:uncharacterized repeat protein (TIGR03803 family)
MRKPKRQVRGRLFAPLCLACLLPAAAFAQTYSETVLHSFGTPPVGAHPDAGLTPNPDGSFDGTAVTGGKFGAGVIFNIDASGHQTVLYSFTGGADGAFPYAGVIHDPAGNLYGTTAEGGASNMGVVFKLDPAGNQTVIHSFTGKADGADPDAGVIRDTEGNLYGVAESGGAKGYGVVFKIDTSGAETVLHNFTGGADGAFPTGGLARDAAGNLYGTASEGGIAELYSGVGTVFKLTPSGHLTVLHKFSGSPDGASPQGALILDSSGNIYGTTSGGGVTTNGGQGTVFMVTPSGNETVLYAFTGGNDGAEPECGLIRDSEGNLYGTTAGGGPQSAGTVFEVTSPGHETLLFSFTFGDAGQYPEGSLVRDSAGNLVGTASYGGPGNVGVIFELNSSNQESILYSFPNSADGYLVDSPLSRDAAGNLYGTTFYGGPAGKGVLYKVTPAGQETVLHAFVSGANDGSFPRGALALDNAGNVYGTTEYGAKGSGTVYKFGSNSKLTLLYGFTGGSDGKIPYGGVFRGPSGDLYGTTNQGGASNVGGLFRVDNSGHESVLYNFAGPSSGDYPFVGVVRDSKGNLYGTSFDSGSGLAYKVDPSGKYTVLHRFTGGDDGGSPSALTLDAEGNLYGTAGFGGKYLFGVVFKIEPSGAEKVLYNFQNKEDGGVPAGSVTLDSAGNIYGTASQGGTNQFGVVFKVTPEGKETVLFSFTGGADGAYPEDGVILDPAGNIYGTALDGGAQQGGVLFELKPAPGAAGPGH